ncbi:MAG: rod shape-determining protein RodA [Bacteroidia bacterium]|nr:rod shape-determining protein RodA [Bacteroidia bacterium]
MTIVLYFALVIIGWLNIYAAVYNDESKSIYDISQKYGMQLIWIGSSIVLIFLIFLIDSNFYSFFAYILYALTIGLLVSVLFFGKEVNGARSWFQIGGFRLQPAEFAKLATCLAISKLLSSSNMITQKFRTLFLMGIFIAIPSGLVILQNDTGTALVYSAFILVLYREGWVPGNLLFFCVLIVALFIATLLVNPLSLIIFLIVLAFVIFGIMRRRLYEFLLSLGIFIVSLSILYGINHFLPHPFSLYYVIALAAGVSCIAYFILNLWFKIPNLNTIVIFLALSITFTFTVDYLFDKVLSEHQRTRITVLLGMETDLKGAGYNVNQSKIAIGSGGFWGKGFLQGTQTKYDFVPEQSTDFIFCTIGEEFGFLGSTIVIGLFVALLLRIIFLAERQRSLFSRIYGYAVASVFLFHLVINIGMTIGLAPVIGIPLPFFSYGGSSLWAFTILLFIFIRLDASRLELLA